jgi:AcrR family transcriptional regulator
MSEHPQPDPVARAQRPRVEGGREQEILDATLDLLLEVGYDRLTLDAVAARSKASKATLYRRWAGKVDLVVDAVVRLKGEVPAAPDTGGLLSDLQALAAGQHGEGIDDEAFDVMCAVSTAVHRDPELRTALLARFLAPRQTLLREILRQAQDRGEVRADADLDLIADILPSMLLYRVSLGEPLPPGDLFLQIVQQILLPSLRPGTG